jgi:hypothetical protein
VNQNISNSKLNDIKGVSLIVKIIQMIEQLYPFILTNKQKEFLVINLVSFQKDFGET